MNDLNARQNKIIELVQGFHFMTVKQLAQKLNVSEMTVRRDIGILSEKKLVNQVYGGVTALEPQEAEKKYSIVQEQRYNTTLKKRVAQKAIELMGSQEIVFLDSGSTVQALAELIPSDARHTIITSSFNTLEVVVKLCGCTVISPGGIYAPEPKMFYSYNSVDFIDQYRATKCFIGTTGYDLALGLTCSYMEDVPLKQSMLKSSRERILLIDSSKFGKVSAHLFGHIEDFSTVITDDGIPQEYIQSIGEKDIELIIV